MVSESLSFFFSLILIPLGNLFFFLLPAGGLSGLIIYVSKGKTLWQKKEYGFLLIPFGIWLITHANSITLGESYLAIGPGLLGGLTLLPRALLRPGQVRKEYEINAITGILIGLMTLAL